MSREYTSFEQIDNDLKILKLKKDIDFVCLKTDYQSLIRNLSTKRILSDLGVGFKDYFFAKKQHLISLVASFLWNKLFKK